MSAAKKTAVVLFNLGGPDSRAAIRPFLLNFFMDKNIIRLPLPLRWLIAKRIAWRRSRREAGDSYGHLGGKSPLLENTTAQAEALQEVLGERFRVFVSMRYWHPMVNEVVEKVKKYNPDHIVLLPLYPQFSTTTTRSSFQTWDAAAAKAKLNVPVARVCCYPWNDGFVAASAELVRTSYEQAAREGDNPPRVLFSAHGLPENVIRDGDPYQWQCEQSAAAIAAQTGIADLDWTVCYQSRVGPRQWIGPSTGEELHRAARDRVPVVVYPHAFTQEHVETLVEIEIEYRELAHEIGVPGFYRVPAVGPAPGFIAALADLVKARLNDGRVCADGGERLCPQQFRRCCMKMPVGAQEHGGLSS